MNVLVLLNCSAGSGTDAKAERGAQVQQAFARHGVDATINIVAGPQIAQAARKFRAMHPPGAGAGHDALVVAGGDGSISAAAAELAGSDLPLGILAFGTLNHFAKDLGLPLDLDAAVQVIAAQQTRRIDVGRLNDRVFVNNSSVGLYPFMVASRNDGQRRFGLSKLAATLPALARTLLGASWHRLDIVLAGERQRVRTPCVFVGNNRYATDIATFGTRDRLDSGQLCVFVVRGQTRLGLLLLPFRIALHLADRSRDVETFSAAGVEIFSRRKHLHVSLDGEIAAMQTPLRYACQPGALCVLAPPPAVAVAAAE